MKKEVMTVARSKAAAIVNKCQSLANGLPVGTVATIPAGWQSKAAGLFRVDVYVHRLDSSALVEFHVEGHTKHGEYIATHDDYYASLNWSEADCIHLCKAGDELLAGLSELADEMTI